MTSRHRRYAETRLEEHDHHATRGSDAWSARGRPAAWVPASVQPTHRFADLAATSAPHVVESPAVPLLGTRAFTVHDTIYLSPGILGDDSMESRHVLGHELAHVAQQREGRVPDGPPGIVSDRGLEQEADRAGDRLVRGPVGLPTRTPPTQAAASAGAIQLYGGESDYVREIVQGGGASYSPADAPLYATDGPKDARMAPKSGMLSDAFNWAVTSGMDLLGFDTRQRAATEDNDFYRDYAKYMPGYDIDGIPSGAWAQNAATNHVGHGRGPGDPWDNVRRSLVDQEKGMIDSDLAAGGSGQLGYWDVYGAHQNAYDASGGHNSFIDPGSFALAVYGAPLLEAAGIDSGPVTGASIDIFNDPTDSASAGWAKRMGLAGAEVAGGAGMGALGLATGNPLMMLGGAATTGLGAFGAAWNTGSALSHGMLDEWSSAVFGP